MISRIELSRGSRHKQNRLSHWMLRRGKTVDDLVKACFDANATAIDLMEKDKCLPTRTDLPRIAKALDVQPTDIWPKDRLDLLGLASDSDARSDHNGQKRECFWLSESESKSLEQAIKALGYISKIAWFRDMAARTLKAAEDKGVY